jgi:outer membrane protein assembly factor BamB
VSTFVSRGRSGRLVSVCAAILTIGACGWLDDGSHELVLKQVWSSVAGANTRGTPLVVGTRVVQAFTDRTLRAFDLANGRALWSVASSDEGLWPVTLIAGPDSVIVVTAAASVRGHSVGSGQMLWTFRPPIDSSLDGEPGSLAVHTLAVNAAKTQVVVPAWGSSVTALRVATGQPLWTWSPLRDHARRHGANGAVWCGDRVFVSLWRYIDERGVPSEHSVAALDAATGRELWTTVLPVGAFIVAANGWMECDASRVWVATMGGPLWALGQANGSVVHRMERSPGYLNSAYSVVDGSERWRASAVVPPYIRMVGGERYLWLTDGSYLSVFDARDGRRVIYETGERGVSEAPLLLSEEEAILPHEDGLARVVLLRKR